MTSLEQRIIRSTILPCSNGMTSTETAYGIHKNQLNIFTRAVRVLLQAIKKWPESLLTIVMPEVPVPVRAQKGQA